MRNWLPWVCLAVFVALIAAAPWRRPDPHHEFILRLISKLEDTSAAEQPAAGAMESEDLEHRNAARSPDRSSGPGV
jgi:hypothetical protein